MNAARTRRGVAQAVAVAAAPVAAAASLAAASASALALLALVLLPPAAQGFGVPPTGPSSGGSGGSGGPPLPRASMDPVVLSHLQQRSTAAVGAKAGGKAGSPTPVRDILALDFDGTFFLKAVCMNIHAHTHIDRPTRSDRLPCIDSAGVICNSVGESSQAAYRSVRKLWPQLATFCTPLTSANTPPGPCV